MNSFEDESVFRTILGRIIDDFIFFVKIFLNERKCEFFV